MGRVIKKIKMSELSKNSRTNKGACIRRPIGIETAMTMEVPCKALCALKPENNLQGATNPQIE